MSGAELSDTSDTNETTSTSTKEKKTHFIDTDDEIYQKTEDVTSALTNLGYQRTDAYRIASEICLQNPSADLGTLIRLSLKEFNQ
jgi:Holliday junction resolvasome RuvABC DNA-binding subunit